jgi:putative ABC transport system permease protein
MPLPTVSSTPLPEPTEVIMDVFRQDIRFAWRSLVARRGFTLIAALTLALGIGATTAMFSVVRGVLLKPLPYPSSERIATVWESPPEESRSLDGGLISHPNFEDVRTQTDIFESYAQVVGTNLTVTQDGGGAELVRGARVTPEFFRVFDARPIMGREFTAEEDLFNGPTVAIVSEGYWRDRLGGRQDILGSTIRISGRSHEIVGIAPDGFDYPESARIWLPGQNDDEGCGRGCVTRHSVGRLSAGSTVDGARSVLGALATRLEGEYATSNTGTTFAIATLRDVTVGDVRPALWVLLGAVGMVLLIACANVANLLLVRAQGRSTEIAVRSTLGADSGRILRQLMTESGLLAFIGGAAGVVLAIWSIDVVLSLAPENLPRMDEVGLDATTLVFAIVLVAVTSLLFGFAPALTLAKVDLAQSLRKGGRGDVSGGRTGMGRSAILVAEVALSVMLLTGAGLMIRSLIRMADVQPGFDTSGITVFRLSLPGARYTDPQAVQFMERLQERLTSVRGIEEAAVFVAPPLGSSSMFGSFRRPELPEPEPGEGPVASYRIAGVGALEMLSIPIVAGRGFLPSDRENAQRVVMISQETAERFFPGEDPVGRQMDVQVSAGFAEDVPRTIVGIFGDIRGSSLTQEPEPEMIIPYAQSGASFPNVLLRGSNPAAMLEAARTELQALDPELPLIQPGTMDEWLAEQLAQPRFYLTLLGIFAFLAVLLAAVGIYGVVAYVVSQRRREIGVRMALGARVRQVVQLVLWQGLRPALFGIVIGVTGAYWSTALMRGLLFEVAPQDPITFALVPLMLIAVVVVACAAPAHRATRIAPASALRNDQ